MQRALSPGPSAHWPARANPQQQARPAGRATQRV